jgi:hypothetical protein
MDIDQVGTPTGQFLTGFLAVQQGNRTIINGTTIAGITLRVSGQTRYSGLFTSQSSIFLVAPHFLEFTYFPYSFPTRDVRNLAVVSPLGRMNVSSGPQTFLGVETLRLVGELSDLHLANSSGRMLMTFVGEANHVWVGDSDIARKSFSAVFLENLPFLTLFVTVIGIVPLYVDLWRRTRGKNS